MINARSIATLGIGFGVVAISTLGVIAETQPQPTPEISYSGGAWPFALSAPRLPEKSTSRREEEELMMILAAL